MNLSAELPGWRRFPAAEARLEVNGAPAPAAEDTRLRDLFGRFLDERRRASPGEAVSVRRKEEMFEEFKRWQAMQRP